MSQYPRISIVTPSFNQGRFLERTIESVLGQNYPNIEYFIIDGGSTDESVRLIRSYASRLSGWVSEKDDGQAHAIGKGFDRCTGELFAWLNSSDEYVPGALHRVAEAWMQKRASLYYGNVQIITEEGGSLGAECTEYLDLEAMLYQNIFPFQPGSFWTREAYRAIGGINPSFHFYMDFDLMVRLARHGAMCHVPHSLARLRRHADAKTAGFGGGWQEELKRIRREHVPAGSRIFMRRMLSFTKRLARFIRDRNWNEVSYLLHKVTKTWRPLSRRRMPGIHSS